MTSKSWAWFTWNMWEYVSRSWTFFFEIKHDTKNWTCCEIKIDEENWIFRKNLCLFAKKSQIWTLFNMTQRIELDFQNFDSKNWTLFTKGLKELDPERFVWLQQPHFFMTQGIEHYLNMIQRIEPLSVKHMAHRIAFFVMWLTELNLFLEKTTQRIVFLICYKESNT